MMKRWRWNLAIFCASALSLVLFASSAQAQAPESESAPEPEQKQEQEQQQTAAAVAAEPADAGVDAATADAVTTMAAAELDSLENTLATLRSLEVLRQQLRDDISRQSADLNADLSPGDSAALSARIEALNSDLQATVSNFTEIATGADLSILSAEEAEKFNFQQELFSLAEPLIKELKGLTSHVRAKTVQRDRIAYFEERLPVVETALNNVSELLSRAEAPELKERLTAMREEWAKRQTFMLSQLSSAQLQLATLESSEVSLTEASQSYFKEFINKRGLYLGQALLVVLAIFLLGRLIQRALARVLPGYTRRVRSFETRLLDLTVRILMMIAMIIGPMVVFYLAEDWMLFSIALLLLLGLALTLRQAIPRFWQQIQLFLNIGTVREGERLDIDGLPWRVKEINFFSTLENPTADIEMRLKIDDLVDLRSRPQRRNEPWFPCQRGDWVLMSDSNRGRVIGISPELIQLVQRGGAHLTYTTAEFLAGNPVNLSTNFRLKETIGLSYDLQADSTGPVLAKLKVFVERRIIDEGYEEELLNLRVEFERANESSLDVVIIADFDGKLADVYNRLRRSLQRWCVEACNEYDWEIPYPQLSVHSQQRIAVARSVAEVTD